MSFSNLFHLFIQRKINDDMTNSKHRSKCSFPKSEESFCVRYEPYWMIDIPVGPFVVVSYPFFFHLSNPKYLCLNSCPDEPHRISEHVTNCWTDQRGKENNWKTRLISLKIWRKEKLCFLVYRKIHWMENWSCHESKFKSLC